MIATHNSSFFRRWKDQYIRNADVGTLNQEGRYIASCFLEVLKENKKLRNEIFEITNYKKKARPNKLYINTETLFPARNGKKRYADVSFTNEIGDPLILFEVKMEDPFLRGQIDDYIEICKNKGAKFLVISKFSLSDGEKENIEKDNYGKSITWKFVKKCIEKIDLTQFPITKMFHDFLQEETMTYVVLEKKHEKAIVHFYKRLFLPWWNSGLGNTTTGKESVIQYLPNAMDILISNLKYSLEEIFPKHASLFTYDIALKSDFVAKKELTKDEVFEVLQIEKNAKVKRDGGCFWIFANSWDKKFINESESKKPGLEIVYYLKRSPRKDSNGKKNVRLYAYVYKSNGDIFKESQINFDISENIFIKKIKSLLRNAEVELS